MIDFHGGKRRKEMSKVETVERRHRQDYPKGAAPFTRFLNRNQVKSRSNWFPPPDCSELFSLWLENQVLPISSGARFPPAGSSSVLDFKSRIIDGAFCCRRRGRSCYYWVFLAADVGEEMRDLGRRVIRGPVNLNPPAVSALTANLGLLKSKRVSVLVNGDIVPLLPGCPTLDSTRSPWRGIYLEEHHLPAVPIQDHEHGTFVLHLQMNERLEMDWFSFGRTGQQITGAGNLIFLTPGTRDRLQFLRTSEADCHVD